MGAGSSLLNASGLVGAAQQVANYDTDGPVWVGYRPGVRLPVRRIPDVPSEVGDIARQLESGAYSTTGGEREIRPQYFYGQEWEPAALSQERVAGLQAQLEAAGFLKNYTPGVWDLASADAMLGIMEIANYSEMTWQNVLDQIVAAGGMRKAPTGGTGLGTPQLTDDDIRMVANKTAQGLLGRNLREDEISGFIPAFRGSVASGTSAAAAGETVLRQQVAPTETAAYGLGTAMQTIGAVLEGGGQ
jgi:hypothetical protein